MGGVDCRDLRLYATEGGVEGSCSSRGSDTATDLGVSVDIGDSLGTGLGEPVDIGEDGSDGVVTAADIGEPVDIDDDDNDDDGNGLG